MSSNETVLIISHGHPDLNKGGAEIAAYNLYNELRAQNIDAYFLARTSQTPHGGAAFSSRNGKREILFHTTMDDGFLFSNIKTRHMWQEFRDLLLLIKPTVVHLHHYFLLGIEMLEEIRRTLPQCKIVLTLHEYLAICHNKGLMVKTNGKLCYKASARDCHGCFPDKQPGDFFLREQYIKRLFSVVDHFVSPSEFLKTRYLEWGIGDKPFTVIENGQPHGTLSPEAGTTNNAESVTFAFFGQVNPYKGIDVLLEAVLLLDKSVARKVNVEIHGANLNVQETTYQKKVQKLLKKTQGRVIFHGPYEPHELPQLLQHVDWAIVPSVWWENSPMVIQEAFSQKVPLIVSNIGGMQEKVKDGVDGLHFRFGSPVDLAATMTRCVRDQSIRADCAENIKTPLSASQCAKAHLAIYRGE
ncbi:glycosyltransferase family 4 protein [Alteromonas sp. CYL-A6]|uniref:glycosyltransferase family 4 protein n=1 Tax=Alteromonas nitratireducens TaxID=3390813 RepID=UPI0034B86030